MGNGWCFVHPHQGEEEKQKQEQCGAPGWLGEEETNNCAEFHQRA